MVTNITPSMDFECMRMDQQELNDISKEKNIDFDSNKDNKNKLEYYYIPKCICLVSIHPNVKLYQKILWHICAYGLSQNGDIQIPLEKIITNLIIEVPVPPRGLYSIYYNYNFDFSSKSDEINNDSSSKNELSVPPLKSTENNKLLLTDIDLSKFNKSLSFNCKMETIEHILLQTKILFFSLNLTTIIDTISAFMCLIFPFKYPFQILSCLSKKNYGILESPSPFIMGIKEKFDENFFKINEIHIESQNFFVVDLDSKEEKNYYLFSDEEFPGFPSKLLSNLEKELKSLENSKHKSIREFNENYQEKFFNFFCEILRGYEEFLNINFFNEDFVDLKTLFNCQKFIKCIYHSQADYPFYTKFIEELESQLFLEFILKNMIPKNNNELMDILFVSNYLNPQKKKKNKNDEQNDYTITNKYIVPRPKELTKEEKDQIMKDHISLIKKGQIIKTIKAKDESIIKFDYILFPELNFNIYCNNDNVNQYIQPPDYREEIEALNMEAISKSSLGKNINRAMEMKNYLYLTWLEIWAFTFGNNDLKERHYRFDQMLDVLDKVVHHERNILDLMFNMLNQYEEEKMMIKLYKKILQLKIKPSTLIFDIMKSKVDLKDMKDILDETKKNDKKMISLKFNDYNRMNNRERTFLSINDNLPLETKPKFYFDYDCINIECGAKINLYSISKNFEGVKNDILWVPCSKCGEYNLPKITVKFGLDFINSQSKSTSIEEYVLHSPYNLKTNIKQAFNTQLRNENQNEQFKLQISNFKAQFQPLFWDFIWYCIIHDLDYNILLPYSKTLEEEKKSHFINPNMNIFEVCYDDSTFADNQNKIERISNSIIKLNSSEKMKKIKFKKLKRCSGVIRVEIKDKINIFLNNDIKEEKEEDSIDNISDEDIKDNKKINIKDKKANTTEKKIVENDKTKVKKKVSMFDFFFSVKDKINKVKDEIKQNNKENNKKEEAKDKPKKNDKKKDDNNDNCILGEEYIDD